MYIEGHALLQERDLIYLGAPSNDSGNTQMHFLFFVSMRCRENQVSSSTGHDDSMFACVFMENDYLSKL
jgi:hypothetical protein